MQLAHQAKAKTEKGMLGVVKVNGIFKGVRLPPGKHSVTFYFDNTPYRPGIYVSIIAWMLFVSGWFLAWRKEKGFTAGL